MALEQRKNKTYFYRKQRDGNRVRTEYVGGGGFAELIAKHEAQRREEREEIRQSERQHIAALIAEDEHLDRFDDEMIELTRRVLLTLGFHQHKGQWRWHR